jgi:hypothetical protein
MFALNFKSLIKITKAVQGYILGRFSAAAGRVDVFSAPPNIFF